jgi:hypothetical protein
MDEFKKELKNEVKEAVKEVKETAIEELKKVKDEAKVEAVAWYSKLPLWSKVGVVVLVLGSFFVYEKYVAKTPDPVTVVVNAAPVEKGVVANAVLDRAVAEKADASRLLAKVLRIQVVKQLQVDGIDGKPLSKEAAIALAANLSDDDVAAVAEVSVVDPAQGRVLDTLRTVVKFLIEHKEAVKEIVKLIILLLATFA